MIDTRTIVVPESHSIISEAPSFVNKGRYWFYDVRLTEEAPNQYQKIIANAQNTIWIWDPYFDETSDHEIFQYVNVDEITISIVTSFKDGRSLQNLLNYRENIMGALPAYVKSGKIYLLAYYKNEWHDRFLIIDKKHVYLVGASVNNQREACRTTTGIYQLQDNSAEALFLIEKFKQYATDKNDRRYEKTTKNIVRNDA